MFGDGTQVTTTVIHPEDGIVAAAAVDEEQTARQIRLASIRDFRPEVV
ncbi:MAG: hypothetical protein IPK16_30085 [Anaerolineales bacterium]|nr:hypothetical protein [Anaerolineales bacterium]